MVKNLIVSPYMAKFINNSEVYFADYSKSQDIENISTVILYPIIGMINQLKQIIFI